MNLLFLIMKTIYKQVYKNELQSAHYLQHTLSIAAQGYIIVHNHKKPQPEDE